MKSEKKLEVLLYRHPLKAERETFEVEYQSLGEICTELGLDSTVQEYFFLDGDNPLYDYSEVPSGDRLYIKAVLTGEGGDFAEEGKNTMWGGAGLTLLGGGLILLGALTGPVGLGTIGVIGVSLAISGITTVGAGYYLYTMDIDSDYDTGAGGIRGKELPSIRGSRNTNRSGQKVPILLGRHLVFPWFASGNYTSIPNLPYPYVKSNGRVDFPSLSGTGTQYLHMLLGNTYAPVEVLESTIQIGEIPIEEYLDGGTLSSVLSFQENSSDPVYYPDRVIEEYLGTELVYASPYTFTTAKNTKIAEFTIIFPRGLYYYEGGTASVRFYAEWKDVGAPDSSYQPILIDSYPSTDPRSMEPRSSIQQTVRIGVIKEFDNDTPSDLEYNLNRQYTFRFTRIFSTDYTVSNMYVENMKSYIGTFDGVSAPETWPILPETKTKLNVLSVKIKATDQLSETIDNMNYEIINYQPVYTGNPSLGETGPSYWSDAVTRNPASAFLYVLTNEDVNQDPIAPIDYETRIDYESLETWYTFCEDYNLECNNFLVNDMTVADLLKNIVSTGFASWNVVDNKYTIYIDTYNTTVTQLFTPRNSWGFQGAKAFAEAPTCLEIPFTNSFLSGAIDSDALSEGGFTSETRYIYADGRSGDTDPLDSDIVEKASVFGAMAPDQVWRLGRYLLACSTLRPENYSFYVDIEHIMCTRWDRIKLQHDVPLFGLTSGRVLYVNESGGNTLSFESDEIIQYEIGKSYAIQIRKVDGTISTYDVDNLGINSTTVTFSTPVVGVGVFVQDDLFSFGETGLETIDLIITNIEAMDNESARLTCVEYNESIYDAYLIGSGAIPAYTSRVSLGGSSGPITVNTLPESQEETSTITSSIASNSTDIVYRTSIVTPKGSVLNSGVSFYPDAYFDSGVTTVVYVAYWNGHKIYKNSAETGKVQTIICDSPARFPKIYEDGLKVLYISASDNHLYLKDDLETVEDGTAVYTANDVVGYTFHPISYNIFVWTYTNVYELDASDGFSLLNTYTLIVRDMVITDDGEVFYIKNDGYIYSNNLTFSSENLFYNGATVTQIQKYNTSIYFIRGDLGLIYSKEVSDTDTSTSTDSSIATSVTWGFTITGSGEVIYSNVLNGFLYLASTTNAISNPTLTGEPLVLGFSGDLTSGSNIITNIDNSAIDQLAEGDVLSAEGLSDGTTIRALGNTEIEINVNAVSTINNAEIIAGGDRILLDANKVIINGTVEANKLSSSAIDSKARASNGEKISEISLDEGTMIYRNSAGDSIFDFDPNRVGSELVIDGTITASEIALLSEDVVDGVITTQKISTGDVSLESSNFVTGVSGWKIDNATDSAEFNNITARGTIEATSGIIGAFEISVEDGLVGSSGTGAKVVLDPATSDYRSGTDDTFSIGLYPEASLTSSLYFSAKETDVTFGVPRWPNPWGFDFSVGVGGQLFSSLRASWCTTKREVYAVISAIINRGYTDYTDYETGNWHRIYFGGDTDYRTLPFTPCWVRVEPTGAGGSMEAHIALDGASSYTVFGASDTTAWTTHRWFYT